MPVYSTVKEVLDYTGVEPEQLGKASDEELAAVIQGWLVQAKDLIDADRNRDFHKEAEAGKLSQVPPGIHNIAMRMVANMVGIAVFRRETGVVKLGEFELKMVKDSIFTTDIERDLSRYAKAETGPEDAGGARRSGSIPLRSQFYESRTYEVANG